MFEKRSLRILIVLIVMLILLAFIQANPLSNLPYASASDSVMFRLAIRTPGVLILWLIVWLVGTYKTARR